MLIVASFCRQEMKRKIKVAVPVDWLVMLRIASSALTSSVLPAATSRRASVVAPAQRQVSQVLLAAAALSILGSSRVMSAAAANPAGECANPQGPVPQNIQNMASDILKVCPATTPCQQWYQVLTISTCSVQRV